MRKGQSAKQSRSVKKRERRPHLRQDIRELIDLATLGYRDAKLAAADLTADEKAALERAERQCVADALTAVRCAYSQDWRAAAWLLERFNPDQFGKRAVVKVDAAQQLSADELDELARRVLHDQRV